MVEGHVDDEMIEIGDPTEEPMVAEPPPRVVLEYRDRGVPWMLIPPLLMLSALAAVLAYPRLAHPPFPDHQTAPSLAVASPPTVDPVIPNDEEFLPPPVKATPIPVEPAQMPELVVEAPVLDLVANAEPAPFPRVPGLGFDPKALESDRTPEAAADPALVQAGQDAPRADPDRAMERPVGPDGREIPDEIDVELLPPDPRQARVRHQQRLAEAKKQADDDRVQFHAELRAICQKFKSRGGSQIDQLCKSHAIDLEPAIKQKAVRLLGERGAYVGASQPVRIRLLRSLGFPESAILFDLFEHVGTFESSATRGGFDSDSEKLYHCSLILLRNPPPRAATAALPGSSKRADASNRAAPAGLGSSRNAIPIPASAR